MKCYGPVNPGNPMDKSGDSFQVMTWDKTKLLDDKGEEIPFVYRISLNVTAGELVTMEVWRYASADVDSRFPKEAIQRSEYSGKYKLLVYRFVIEEFEIKTREALAIIVGSK